MKRHRNQEVGIRDGQAQTPHLGHEIAEGAGERSPAKELECVEGLADDAAISGRRSGVAERGWVATAVGASMSVIRARPLTTGEAPEWNPAGPAPRRSQALDPLPACSAQGIAPARAERPPTNGTHRREHQVQKRGEPAAPGGWAGRRADREMLERWHPVTEPGTRPGR